MIVIVLVISWLITCMTHAWVIRETNIGITTETCVEKRKFIDDSFMRNCHWIATLVLKFFVQRKMNLKMQRLMVNIMHVAELGKNSSFFLKIFENLNGNLNDFLAVLFCCSKNRIFTVTLECIIIFSSNSNLACS